MTCDLVEAHWGRWPIRPKWRILAISPGGYHGWRGRTRRSEALVVSITAIHAQVKARDGSPRIHAELAARGES
jgi:putative transposase